MSTKELYRTSGDAVIAGVCGGLAKYFGITSAVMRLIALFLILVAGLSLWAYIILWIVMPKR